jgi:hypothetical protein
MAENDKPQSNASPAPQDKPKIVIDDDWKAQAQREKEKLAKEVEAGPKAAAGAAAGPAGQAGGQRRGRGGPRELPPPTFSTLVNSLVTQAFMHLGGMEDPQTKRRYVDLDLAKHHIDTLAMLEEKCKGNLTEEETKLLDQALDECRLQFVNIAQRVSPAPGM